MLRINVYPDKSGQWRWQMMSANSRIIADSGEGYVTEYNAMRAAFRLLELAPNTPVFNAEGVPYTNQLPTLLAPPDPF